MNDKLKSMVDTIMEQLEKMTAEERLEWFANDPALHLRFMNEMDGTTYIVRCHFDEKASESIFAKTQRLLLKRNDISRK